MGFLRGFGLVIACVLLFIALLLTGVFASLTLSLDYENVQPKISSIANDVIVSQIGFDSLIAQISPYIDFYCQNNTEVIQNFQGYTFVFPCSVLRQGSQSIVNYGINYLVEDFYYKDYNCSFVKCFESNEAPLFLVSQHAQNYWKSLYIKMLIASLVLLALVFLLCEKKSNSFIISGAIIVAASFFVLQLEKIGSSVSRAVLSPISLALTKENMKEIISDLVEVFFSESGKVFLWMFVAGLILIALGIVLKGTGLGIKIKNKIEEIQNKNKIDSSVSKEEVKDIVKKEVLNSRGKQVKNKVMKKG